MSKIAELHGKEVHKGR